MGMAKNQVRNSVRVHRTPSTCQRHRRPIGELAYLERRQRAVVRRKGEELPTFPPARDGAAQQGEPAGGVRGEARVCRRDTRWGQEHFGSVGGGGGSAAAGVEEEDGGGRDGRRQYEVGPAAGGLLQLRGGVHED